MVTTRRGDSLEPVVFEIEIKEETRTAGNANSEITMVTIVMTSNSKDDGGTNETTS